MKKQKHLLVLLIVILTFSCHESKEKVAENVTEDLAVFDINTSGQIDDTLAIKMLGLKVFSNLETKSKNVLLQTAVSLKKYCPSVASQNYGTCYSYAAAYAARTILYNVTVNDSITPDKNAFSPGFLQRLVFGSGLLATTKCKNKGTDTHYACKQMELKGCLKLVDYPDDCSKMTLTPTLMNEALKYKIKSVGLYESCIANEEKINRIKATLNDKKPVIICINNSDSFYAKNGDTEIWIPTENDKKEIKCSYSNHALCVIGYDDTKYGGAFEIMNSYSKNWKGDGFVWVRYNDFADYAAYAIEISNPE